MPLKIVLACCFRHAWASMTDAVPAARYRRCGSAASRGAVAFPEPPRHALPVAMLLAWKEFLTTD
jgi:hypothetical protein